MVSTRGIKFKFTEGERVLCYEPDPTKAKVLYESKVLELVITRDSRGRKAPEYLVHFQGWNSSWDRCVGEDFVLPDNQENRELQRKLAYDAALNFIGRLRKGSKKKKKLPAIFKDSLIKRRCLENRKDDQSEDSEEATETSEDNEDEDEEDMEDNDDETDDKQSEEAISPFSDLQLSNLLKEKLEDDCFLITARNKLVKLPCEPNVISILEGYVKQLSFGLLYSTPSSKTTRNHPGKRRSVSAEIEAKINLTKELVDGLRVFFDFALPLSLLYKEEKPQFDNIGNLVLPEIIPALPSSVVPHNLLLAPKDDFEESSNEAKMSKDSCQESLPWHSFHPVSQPPQPPELSSSWNAINKTPHHPSSSFPRPTSPPPPPSNSNATAPSPKKHLTRLRHTRNSRSSPLNQSSPLNRANDSAPVASTSAPVTSGGISNVATIRTRTWARSQSLLKGSQSPTSSGEETFSTRRVTRSFSDKSRFVSLSDHPLPPTKLETIAASPLSLKTEPPRSDSVVSSPTTEQCAHSVRSASPPLTLNKLSNPNNNNNHHHHHPNNNNNNNNSSGQVKCCPSTPVKTSCGGSTIIQSPRASPPLLAAVGGVASGGVQPLPPLPLNLNSISSVSSSASSTHSDSTMLTKRTMDSKRKSREHLKDPSGFLNEILSWQLMKQSVCVKTKPTPPSLVYGAQHLLRLFVKLPDYLERMNIPNYKQKPLIEGVEGFMKYIEEKCEELLPSSAYKDHSIENTENNNFTNIKKESET